MCSVCVFVCRVFQARGESESMTGLTRFGPPRTAQTASPGTRA
jgi:hypothetical protein